MVSPPKGGRQRYTLLSDNLLTVLRDYYRQAHPKIFLFPGTEPLEPVNKATGQNIFYGAVAKARLPDRGGIHSLRHAYASHLLFANYDLQTIQRLLGHSDIKTTMIYLQTVPSMTLKEAKSPLDCL